MNKKDCIEYDSCMEGLKVCNGVHFDKTNDPETNELVIDLVKIVTTIVLLEINRGGEVNGRDKTIFPNSRHGDDQK